MYPDVDDEEDVVKCMAERTLKRSEVESLLLPPDVRLVAEAAAEVGR